MALIMNYIGDIGCCMFEEIYWDFENGGNFDKFID